ncbi:MAG: hypothetical protein KF901_31920 [Myxococcales bacterium]|nr:hypothetical protein [Myxococcales bacterium]
MMLGLVVACVSLGCAPVSVMDYHRTTLDPMARDVLACPDVEVVDVTPERQPPVEGDPDTRRYEARGCERTEHFTCFTLRRTDAAEAPTCRSLRAPAGGMHLGPFHVGGR